MGERLRKVGEHLKKWKQTGGGLVRSASREAGRYAQEARRGTGELWRRAKESAMQGLDVDAQNIAKIKAWTKETWKRRVRKHVDPATAEEKEMLRHFLLPAGSDPAVLDQYATEQTPEARAARLHARELLKIKEEHRGIHFEKKLDDFLGTFVKDVGELAEDYGLPRVPDIDAQRRMWAVHMIADRRILFESKARPGGAPPSSPARRAVGKHTEVRIGYELYMANRAGLAKAWRGRPHFRDLRDVLLNKKEKPTSNDYAQAERLARAAVEREVTDVTDQFVPGESTAFSPEDREAMRREFADPRTAPTDRRPFFEEARAHARRFSKFCRKEHVTPEMLKKLNDSIIAEVEDFSSDVSMPRPLFDLTVVFDIARHVSGEPSSTIFDTRRGEPTVEAMRMRQEIVQRRLGIAAWNAFYNPENGTDKSDAFVACWKKLVAQDSLFAPIKAVLEGIGEDGTNDEKRLVALGIQIEQLQPFVKKERERLTNEWTTDVRQLQELVVNAQDPKGFTDALKRLRERFNNTKYDVVRMPPERWAILHGPISDLGEVLLAKIAVTSKNSSGWWRKKRDSLYGFLGKEKWVDIDRRLKAASGPILEILGHIDSPTIPPSAPPTSPVAMEDSTPPPPPVSRPAEPTQPPPPDLARPGGERAKSPEGEFGVDAQTINDVIERYLVYQPNELSPGQDRKSTLEGYYYPKEDDDRTKNMRRYAEALIRFSRERHLGIDVIKTDAALLADSMRMYAGVLRIPLTSYGRGNTWAMYDIAKQIARSRSEYRFVDGNSRYSRASPYESAPPESRYLYSENALKKRDEIIDRHLGWEAYVRAVGVGFRDDAWVQELETENDLTPAREYLNEIWRETADEGREQPHSWEFAKLGALLREVALQRAPRL